MFHSARIKLTAYYLLIVMLISILFSAAIYTMVIRELYQDFHHLDERAGRIFQPPSPSGVLIEPGYMKEAQQRVLFNLIDLNIVIFITSSIAGYILAGVALRPIKEMVDEQNRFITDASHELRTPITALRTEIEVALRDKKLGLVNAKEVLSSNLEEITALQALSESLLKLSRLQKKNKKNFSPFDIKEVIDEAIKKVTPLAKLQNIRIESSVKEVVIQADRQSILELFIILLDNAIKYSTKNTSVIVQTKKRKNKLQIAIKDYGIGIAKEDISLIFDRFYRSDRSRSKTVSGHGLGLSIAQKFVEEHNGSISVESELGVGSTFTVLLPTNASL